MPDLNARQQAALSYMTEVTSPPRPGADRWEIGTRWIYAFTMADYLVSHGLMERSRRSNGYRADSTAASNTLVALKRRGLVDNDGGGCFVQNKWWITLEGLEAAR